MVHIYYQQHESVYNQDLCIIFSDWKYILVGDFLVYLLAPGIYSSVVSAK